MAFEAPKMFEKKKSTVILREQLLECFAASEKLIATAVENFESQSERTLGARIVLARQLLSTLDELLASADWDSSPFVAQLLKPTNEKRLQLVSFLEDTQVQVTAESWALPVCPANCVSLYISLYQSVGADMEGWVNQLLDLSSHVISRPIYADLSACERSIRLSGYSMNDAYALLYFPTEYLLTAQKDAKVDKWGQSLLQLNCAKVSSRCVQAFYYQGDTYYLSNDQLVKVEKSTSDKDES